MKSRYLIACAIAALVAAWSVEARAQRGAAQPEIANSKAAQDLIAHAMAIAKDDLKAEATDACLPGQTPGTIMMTVPVMDHGIRRVWLVQAGALQVPDKASWKAFEHVINDYFKKEMPEMVFNSHSLTMSDGLSMMAEIRKNPNGPNPYVLGKAKTARYLDIMLACRHGWVVEKDPSAL